VHCSVEELKKALAGQSFKGGGRTRARTWDPLIKSSRPLNGIPKLDRIDLNILVQLQKDGRMTNANLAEAVGLSASPCLQRVKRLEAAGYIRGYGAQINLAKLTESITVFTEITLVDHRKEDFVKSPVCATLTS
jgi:hypothetical protein